MGTPVQAIKSVYIRRGPGRQYPALGVAPAGGKLMMMDGKTTGESYKGFSDWYYQVNAKGERQFYWAGAFTESITPIPSKTDYASLVNVPPEWAAGQGKGITVAILDTGCYVHAAISDAIVARYNVFGQDEDVDDRALDGHGTFIAGIIGARNDLEVGGLAKNVQLVIIKVAAEQDGLHEKDVFDGLTWLANHCPVKPDVINISLQFAANSLTGEINALFKKFRDDGVFIYSGGENDDSLATDVFYPGTDDNVIAVGAMRCDCSLLQDLSRIQPKVRYIAPNVSYYSLGNSVFAPYTYKQGCSFATASLSGMTALALAYYRQNNLSTPFQDLLHTTIEALNPSAFTESHTIYRIP